MAENKPFVVNDRRKFTADGEIRPDAPQSSPSSSNDLASEPSSPQATPVSSSAATTSFESGAPPTTEPEGSTEQDLLASPDDLHEDREELPPAPTAEETQQVSRAYDATVDRLDTAMRATNPGGERMPPMTFERLIQSLYMQSLLQLGGAAEPGQPPRVDLIGARQTIDMLAVLTDKVAGNLNEAEDKLLQSALFELRMGFLEVTQALARQAATRQPGAKGGTPIQTGPSIVR